MCRQWASSLSLSCSLFFFFYKLAVVRLTQGAALAKQVRQPLTNPDPATVTVTHIVNE